MIILASSSKRRIDLLKDAGVKFEVIPSFVSEDIDPNLKPEENVLNIAVKKAKDVATKHKDRVVLAADTIVTLKNNIYGKPKNEEDAFNILKELSGNTHLVITAVCIINNGIEDSFISKTKVTFKNLLDSEIHDYIKTNEPFGKAGAYAIQGLGKSLIEKYEGDFFTIVGLPLKEVLKKLKNL